MKPVYEITGQVLEDLKKRCEMNAITKTTTNGIQTSGLSADMLNSFINYIDASPQTIATYSRGIRQFFRYLAINGITNPTREDVIAWRDELKRTCKPSTTQTYVISVRLFFQWTAQTGIYPNVAEKVKGAKLNRGHKRDYLSSSQLKSVLAGIDRSTAEGRRNYAIFSLMATCGLRDIEVTQSDIQDMRVLGEDTVLFLRGKGRQEKTEFVKVMPEVELAIRQSLADRKDTNGSSPLFVSYSNNSKGKRISTRSVSAIIKSALVSAGFNSDKLTSHSLRHSAITIALLNGNNIQDVQAFARHADISTTMIYAHNVDRTKSKCEASIASAIF